MNRLIFRLSLLFTLTAILLFHPTVVLSSPSKDSVGISARRAADYVHGIIEAGRTIYSQTIVDRLSKSDSLKTTENWKQDNTLPLPAQFLMMSSHMSNQRGIGMRYRLMSLWPINPKNTPPSQTEKRGLKQVTQNPSQPFTWVVQKKGVWYYEAIYPDKAVAESCVSCHNHHPQSPKTDFKVGDVMGGIVIDLPLGRRFNKKPNDPFLFPPEVVADYVHSILESNRAVYARHIVDRLESRGIMSASEFWEQDHTLMLPAQFLMNTSRLIRKKGLDLDFQLISLWPINMKNSPGNKFEQMGLETLDYHPIRPYTGKVQVGRKQFFQSIYADLAVTPACVECHNAHPKSPKRDFKLQDVMGGVVVTLPIP
jgi:cytochrome c553